MNKILTLAALLGYAMGNQVFGWEKTENLLDNEWANLNVKLDFDWSYGTHWFKIPATESTYGYGTHIYGADTHSRLAFTAWGDYAKFFQTKVEYKLVPFYIAPYQQTMRHTNTNSQYQDDYRVYVSGQRTVNLMELTVTKTENTKINHVSIVDYIEDDRENIHPGKDDWMFYDQYESEYEDVYMSNNLLEEWDAEPTADWYGTHTYWEKWLVNEP